MDPDADIELAYHTFAQLLSTLPDMDSQGLQFIGPIITEYEPSSALLVERTGPQALDPAHPVNNQFLMIQAHGSMLFSALPQHSSIQWQEATLSFLASST